MQVPERFRSARTTLEVRSALVATRLGRLAVRTQWVSAVALASAAILQALRTTAFRPTNPVVGAAAGYLCLMVARDLTALPGVRALQARRETT